MGFSLGTLLNPVAALGSAFAGTPITAERKAAKAQRRAASTAQRMADLASARSRRKAVRERRVALAANLTRAASTGSQGSSSFLGAQGALTSNFASGASFFNAQQRLGQLQTGFLNEANRQQSRARTATQLMDLGTKAAGLL